MGGKKHGEISQDLARAAARFEAWRGETRFGARIPQSLWGLAVELAERHGVSRTAGALKLDYYSLKKRLAAKNTKAEASQPPAAAPAVRPSFVELAAAPFVTASECLIEFENAAGAKMRVFCKGRELPDLAALGRDFWEAG